MRPQSLTPVHLARQIYILSKAVYTGQSELHLIAMSTPTKSRSVLLDAQVSTRSQTSVEVLPRLHLKPMKPNVT